MKVDHLKHKNIPHLLVYLLPVETAQPWSSEVPHKSGWCAEALVQPWLGIVHTALFQMLMYPEASGVWNRKTSPRDSKQNKQQKKNFILSCCFQRPAGSHVQERLSEMQRREVWKGWIKKAVSAVTLGNWPVQSEISQRNNLVPSGKG